MSSSNLKFLYHLWAYLKESKYWMKIKVFGGGGAFQTPLPSKAGR